MEDTFVKVRRGGFLVNFWQISVKVNYVGVSTADDTDIHPEDISDQLPKLRNL